MASKEVVPADAVRAAYPALLGGDSSALELIEENLGTDGIRPMDLDRVGIPGGGGTMWSVPSLEGQDDIRELEGIIVAWQAPRVYWMTKPDDREGDTPVPPDCSSDDGVYGLGMYGPGSAGNAPGTCGTCPMNEWGSADPTDEKARGKACREQRLLYMMRPGSALPISVSLPPTSIQPLRKYLLRLASNGTPYYGAVTKLVLKPQGQGARKWSVAEPSLVTVLDAADLETARKFSETFRAAIEAARRDAAVAADTDADVEAEAFDSEP